MIENTIFPVVISKVCPSVEKTEDINVTKCKYIFNKNLNNKLHSEINVLLLKKLWRYQCTNF